MKIDSHPASTESMAAYAQFLARHALWLFAVPILYAGLGKAVEGKVPAKIARGVGIALCIILMVLVGLPIYYHLF